MHAAVPSTGSSGRARRASAKRPVSGLLLGAALVVAGCGGATPERVASVSPSSSPTAPPNSPAPSAAATTTPTSTPTGTQAQSAFGTLPSTELDATRAAALQQVLDATVEGGAPDAIAAVITADGTWAGAAGIGGPDGRKATARDEFAIASVTKMFTATLVLRLAEQGRIDLDAPLSSYLGDLKVDANGATVRQTLGMMGGFAEDAPNAADRIHADVTHAWTGAELVKEFGPATAPGTTYRYSNAGYALLALAAAHVTGMPFATAMRAQVLDPVVATRIGEQGDGQHTPKPWALPTADHMGSYSPNQLGAGGALPCVSSSTYSIGGASMASDAPSLAAWVWHLFAGDVVNDRSLTLMSTIGEGDYGLGMERIVGVGPGTALGHTGGKTGYGSMVVAFPEQRTVVVVFVNDPDFIDEPTVTGLVAASVSR